MLEQLKEMLKEVLADDELFTLSAKVMKKSYEALIAEGFTPDQAIKIVAGQGVGVKSS